MRQNFRHIKSLRDLLPDITRVKPMLDWMNDVIHSDYQAARDTRDSERLSRRLTGESDNRITLSQCCVFNAPPLISQHLHSARSCKLSGPHKWNKYTHTHTQNPGPYGHINTSECNPVNRVSQMTKLIREILSGSSLCAALMCERPKTHAHIFSLSLSVSHTHTQI